jgi:outer membrane receptor protein involved in Fe transport
VVGAAGLSYLYSDLLHVYVDWSQGFRAPNLQETTVMGNTGKDYEVPNAELKPMTSNTLELGTKLHTVLGSFGGAVYRTWIDDTIYRGELSAQEIADLGIDPAVLGTQKAYRRINVGSAEYQGFEAKMETRAWSGLRLKAAAAYVKGDVTDKDDQTEAATRVPPWSGSASLLFDDPWRHFVFAEAQILWALKQDRLSDGDREDLRICEDPANPGKVLADCKGTPGWAVVNLRAGVRPFQGSQVTLGLENLLDEQYKIHGSGVDGPGFNATLMFSMVL